MLDNLFQPVGSMILVRELDKGETYATHSGIILTADLNRYTTKAEVVAVGDGEKNKNTGARVPNDVEVGDTVYYTAYSGNTEITGASGEKLVLVANRDILVKEA